MKALRDFTLALLLLGIVAWASLTAAPAHAQTQSAMQARTANIATAGNGDVLPLISTAVGAQLVRPYSIPEADWFYPAATAGILNTTTAVTMKAAATGLRNYVTGCQVMAEALGAATELAIRDGAGGTVLWRTKIGTGGLTGYSMAFHSPLRGSVNTLLEVVTLTASVTGAVYVNCQGFTAP